METECGVVKESMDGEWQMGLRLLGAVPARDTRLASFKVFGAESDDVNEVSVPFDNPSEALADSRSFGNFAIKEKEGVYWGVAQYCEGFLAAAANHAPVSSKLCNARMVVTRVQGKSGPPDCYLLNGSTSKRGKAVYVKEQEFIHL